MAKYGTENIRNIALLGHGGAGKTTLAERILFHCKATTRAGSVLDGSTLFDYEADEKERQQSINSAIASCNLGGTELNIIDCPGMTDFVSDALNALVAADLALICVDANAGVKVNTRRMWKAAEEQGMPCFVVVTRLDGEHADFEKTLRQIQDTLGQQCIPLYVPKGAGSALSGVDSVLGENPGDAAKAVAEKLTETVVETDEELTMRYLEGEAISPEEIRGALKKGVVARGVFPVIPVASEPGVGIAELLDAIRDFGPLPTDRVRKCAPVDAGEDAEWKPLDQSKPVARVFKSTWTQFGRMGVFRILAGELKAGDSVYNVRTGKTEKLGHLYRPFGKEIKEVPSAVNGEIVAVTKVDDLDIDDVLVKSAGDKVQLVPLKRPKPMVSLAVQPKSRGDEQKISGALGRLADEDRTFDITRDKQTREMVVHGMSGLHLDIMLGRLKARSGVEVTTSQPKIPYKETIAGKGEAKYRHKKQTGGAGEFAEVWLRVFPSERGAGFEYINKVVGGSIPSQFIPSIEKGIKVVLERGILSGSQIIDVSVEVYDGKHHPVDSKDVAFQKAGRAAFKEAFMKAQPQLLEPIVEAEITVPTEHMGAIMSDMTGRRGRIVNTEAEGDYTIITAQAPLSELQTYSQDLRSITAGEGSYLIEPVNYDVVPQHITKTVIEKYKTDDEED